MIVWAKIEKRETTTLASRLHQDYVSIPAIDTVALDKLDNGFKTFYSQKIFGL